MVIAMLTFQLLALNHADLKVTQCLQKINRSQLDVFGVMCDYIDACDTPVLD